MRNPLSSLILVLFITFEEWAFGSESQIAGLVEIYLVASCLHILNTSYLHLESRRAHSRFLKLVPYCCLKLNVSLRYIVLKYHLLVHLEWYFPPLTGIIFLDFRGFVTEKVPYFLDALFKVSKPCSLVVFVHNLLQVLLVRTYCYSSHCISEFFLWHYSVLSSQPKNALFYL